MLKKEQIRQKRNEGLTDTYKCTIIRRIEVILRSGKGGGGVEERRRGGGGAGGWAAGGSRLRAHRLYSLP